MLLNWYYKCDKKNVQLTFKKSEKYCHTITYKTKKRTG